MSPTELVLSRLKEYRKSGKGWIASCPAHDDANPSLSINEGDGGVALLKCHAGCSTKAVLNPLGLRERDLFPKGANRRDSSKRIARHIIETYPYVDENGVTLYETVRYEPKDFRQRRPTGAGRWIWDLEGVRRVPYDLPVVIEAIALEQLVVIVEGEKCVEALKAKGIVATTSVGGAGNWRSEYSTVFRGGNVALLPDNDTSGRRYMNHVARELTGVAATIKIVALPGLPTKGDVVDWFQAGGTVEELLTLIAASSTTAQLPDDEEPEWQPVDTDLSLQSEVAVNGNGRKTQAQQLIEMVSADGDEFWHTPDNEAFVTVTGKCPMHLRVRSREYRDFLSRRFFNAEGKTVGRHSVEDALSVLAGRALYDGKAHTAALRIAEVGDDLYLDIGDSSRDVIKISSSGWEIVSGFSDVRFRRPAGMGALCRPIPGGSIEQFRSLVNIPDDDSWTLFVAWMTYTVRALGPYPVLVFQGQQGSAKSTGVRFLIKLLDPCTAALQSLPTDARELFIRGRNTHIISFDNVSRVADWQSDALCRIATGAGYAARALYTDEDETVFNIRRPIILNGIESFVAHHNDLADRSIVIECPAIPNRGRRDEHSLQKEFELAQPTIVGALLDAVSGAMAAFADVKLESSSRMADFDHWGVALERSLGWAPGRFLRAREQNRLATTELAVDDDAVATSIRALVTRQEWLDTVGELLAALNLIVTPELQRSKEWPSSPKKLSNHLRRIMPDMERVGYRIEFLSRSNTGRLVRITRVSVETPVAATWLSTH